MLPAPVNSQPWFIESEKEQLNIYRTRGKKGVMPLDKMPPVNRIDIGIMLLFIDVYFAHNNTDITKEICPDYPYNNEKAMAEDTKILNATYKTISG